MAAGTITTRITALAWLIALAGISAQVPGPSLIGLGNVVSRDGQVGDVHRYAVDLDAGAFLQLHVAQTEGGTHISLIGPDGATIREVGMIDRTPRDEYLMGIASEAGRYRIDLRFVGASPRAGRYTLRVATLQPAGEHERARDRCFAINVDANRLARVQRLESLAQAIDFFQQAASCWRALEDRALEASTLTSLGTISSLFSQFSPQSIAAYERLAEIYGESGDRERQLASVEELVREHLDNGRFDRSLDAASRAQDLAADVGSPGRRARALHNLALASFLVGEYQRARDAATTALELARTAQDSSTHARASDDLGSLDELAGDFDAARARYEAALEAAPKDRIVKSIVTLHLGLLHLRRGEYDDAERRLRERLTLETTFVQREQEALARLGLGDVRMAQGDRQAAAELYAAARDALARGPSVNRCIAEERLGRLDLEDGRLAEAEARFREMLQIGARSGHLPCTAQGRAALADLAVRRGDLDAASIEVAQVIALNERFREAVPNLESRALGFGALAPAFERAVDISMQRATNGDATAAARAFELNERALARALLDQISAAALDARAAIPPELARERQQAREQWRARLAELQIATRSPAGAKRSEALLSEITSLELRVRDLDAKADAADARGPGFLRPRPLDLTSVQALLDADTQLLEYALGERRSYLWIVSATDLRAVTLPPRAEITAAARAVHEDLASASTAVQPAAQERRRALARLVLGPAASALTARRLVVVATEALALIPFGALPALSETEPPMISRHEILHVPSATTLAAMRTLSARRPRPSKTAVVLADPIFEPADPRVQKAVPIHGAQAPPGVAALGPSFPRLPFSRVEAKAIGAMLPDQVTTFTDGDAARTRVLGDALSDYRVIHFATHGVVHPEIASLSSIVLSIVDKKGAPQDPFVTLSDIYEMRLNADVVVLSACSTGMGKNIPGEGPIGLARAFMYAGAPRVVASLWQVNDSATAELMKRFYQGMLIDRLTAAAALRRAQQQLAAIPRWASPYYWAPFVLQGDWR